MMSTLCGSFAAIGRHVQGAGGGYKLVDAALFEEGLAVALRRWTVDRAQRIGREGRAVAAGRSGKVSGRSALGNAHLACPSPGAAAFRGTDSRTCGRWRRTVGLMSTVAAVHDHWMTTFRMTCATRTGSRTGPCVGSQHGTSRRWSPRLRGMSKQCYAGGGALRLASLARCGGKEVTPARRPSCLFVTAFADGMAIPERFIEAWLVVLPKGEGVSPLVRRRARRGIASPVVAQTHDSKVAAATVAHTRCAQSLRAARMPLSTA